MVPIVNQTCCTCIGALFQTLKKTMTDSIRLPDIAKAEIQPEALLRLLVSKQFSKNAANGSTTAAMASCKVTIVLCGKTASKYLSL